MLEKPSIQHNVALGISYRTAKTELRDKLSLNQEQQMSFLKKVLDSAWCKECVILSTCNRTEFYCVTHFEPAEIGSNIISHWAEVSNVSKSEIKKVSYLFSHLDGVKHLYRVVASLDSLVMGEGQIMGQVKEAYFNAKKFDSVGMYLNQLFQSALALGKMVRSETSINEGAVSISYAAVELCKKVFPSLGHAKVALLGAGEMGYLAALHLKQAGTLSIDVFNRTIEKAMEMAEEVGASAKSLSDLDEELHHYDIVIGATGSPLPVLTEEMVSKALTIRKGSPIIMVDIALPRDMESSIQNLPSAYLFNIDDLQGVIEDNKNKRENSSQEAEKIIAEKSEEFKVWYHSQKVKPTIKTLRQNLENISSKEIEKYKNKLDPNSYEVAKELVHSILGKWLHDPMEELKSLSDEGYSKEASQIVNRIFRLEKSTEDASKKD